MKNFRVFKTVKTKRIISGFSVKNLGVILLFLLLIPYIATFLLGNLKEGSESAVQTSVEKQLKEGRYTVSNRTQLGVENIPLEVYVADKLARTMASDSEPEALKAQAILIRTGIFRQMSEGAGEESVHADVENIVLKENGTVIETEDWFYASVPVSEAVYQAVAETAGLCLFYEGKPVIGAYFAVSNGATRSSDEVGLEEAPYLKSVLCGRDFLSEEYSSTLELSEKEFEEIWESIPSSNGGGEEAGVEGEFRYSRDNAGYVLGLNYKEKSVSGENFRLAYHLESTCFHLSREAGKIVILIKGKGHGLGMSQYGAEQLAAEGKSCAEILEYFFEDVTITKIE